jgi:hypothetical protein
VVTRIGLPVVVHVLQDWFRDAVRESIAARFAGMLVLAVYALGKDDIAVVYDELVASFHGITSAVKHLTPLATLT